MGKIINCAISQNSSYYKVYIEYDCEQNIANNTTKVTAYLRLKQLTDNFDFDTGSSLTVSFVMNGKTYSHTGRININDVGNKGYVHTLASGAETITHNPDGTKQIDFSCNNTNYMLSSGGYGPGSIKLNRTVVTLPTIPRSASLDKITDTSENTITTIDAGNSIRVYYTPKYSGHYYKLVFSCGSYYKTENLGTASSQKYYEIKTDAGWLPSSTSGELTCKLYTYSDSAYSKQIGCQSKSITLNISNATLPTISLTATETLGHGLGAFYLQGISSVKLQANAFAGSGAKLSLLALSGQGMYETSQTSSIVKDVALTSAGSLEFVATATDSRLLTNRATKTITVLPYHTPTYTKAMVLRCNVDGTPLANGGYALCQIQCNVQSIVSGTERNTQTVKVEYRLETANDWTTFATLSATAPTTGIVSVVNSNNPVDPNKTYKFRITITDALGKSVTSDELRLYGNLRPINLSQHNNGVAIGGLSTANDDASIAGKFEVMWPMTTHKKVQLLGEDTLEISSPIECKKYITTLSQDTSTFAGPIITHAKNTQEGYAIVTRTTETAEASGYSDSIYLLSFHHKYIKKC